MDAYLACGRLLIPMTFQEFQAQGGTGGYNGQYYTNGLADMTYTGVDFDYGYGGTQYFFLNGYWGTGGYNGLHYDSNGVADTFTGWDWDYGTNITTVYVSGTSVTLYAGCSGIPIYYPAPSQVLSGVPYGQLGQIGTLVSSPLSDILGAGLL